MPEQLVVSHLTDFSPSVNTGTSGGITNLERGFNHWRIKHAQKFLGCHAHFWSRECIHDTRNYCLTRVLKVEKVTGS